MARFLKMRSILRISPKNHAKSAKRNPRDKNESKIQGKSYNFVAPMCFSNGLVGAARIGGNAHSTFTPPCGIINTIKRELRVALISHLTVGHPKRNPMPRMKLDHPTAAISKPTWQKLYNLAFQIRKLAPWDWMEETDLFAFQPSGAKEPAFISVMGAIGQHHAVGIYPSLRSLNQFWEMQFTPEEFRRPELLLETRQVQVSFEKAAVLDAEEKKLIKDLGYAPRGAHAWPCFQSFHPGCSPWFIDSNDATLLCLGMERLLDFAPRFDENPDLLPEHIGPDMPIPVQMQVGSASDSGWQGTYRTFPYEPLSLQLEVPTHDLDALGKQPPQSLILEVDVSILSAQIGKLGERPRLPYLLIVAESNSGFAYGVDLMSVQATIEDMWAEVPGRLLAILLRHQLRPATILVRNIWMRDLLWIFRDKLGVNIEMVPDLPAIEEIQGAMAHRL
ncbi:MAG: hypothetical protein PHI39_03150 [Kiritimatiellae bacterium]|nr:hypothetical protein [Kiritimatiellia bacterium]